MFNLFRKKEKTVEGTVKTGSAWSRALGSVFQRKIVDDEFWEELEEALVAADLGVSATMDILDWVKEDASNQGINTPDAVRGILRDELLDSLAHAAGEGSTMPEDEPAVLLVVGVNGAGKTTSIAKLANAGKAEGRKVLLAAADTFRAGAIEQLQIWGSRLGVDVIAHEAGGDPGAVAYDAMQAARARAADLVIIDTAGRLHTRHNLMEELKKVRNIVARQGEGYAQRVVLVIDATTGQNGLLQAKAFIEAVECDAVLLTKMDGTARGGIVLAIADTLNLPVWFIGTGETMEDFAVFDPDAFVDTLLPGAAVR